jgi:antitoxin HicB
MTPGKPDVETIAPSTAAKLLLLEEMKKQNVRPVDLAARLHTTRPMIHRLLNVDHPTKIDAINEALAVLGKRIELRVRNL